MAMKQEISTLLAKKMDRKDFLRHVGIAVVAATGFGAVMKSLNSGGSSKSQHVGYGDSAYGGSKQS